MRDHGFVPVRSIDCLSIHTVDRCISEDRLLELIAFVIRRSDTRTSNTVQQQYR
jgi:hypothetical protein